MLALTKNDLWKLKYDIYNNPFLTTAGDMNSLICCVEAVKHFLNCAYSQIMLTQSSKTTLTCKFSLFMWNWIY